MIETKQTKIFYGYVIVLSGFLIQMAMLGTFFTYGIFFEPISTEFRWNRAMISGAHAVSEVVLGIMAIVAGRFTDRFGPRIALTVCGIFLGAGYLLMAHINAGWQLYLFFGVVVGIGMSGCLAPMSSTIARWFVRRRGLMTGILISSLSAGTIIMAPVARWLISTYKWRTSYTIMGIAVLVFIVAIAQLLKRDPAKVGQLPDGDTTTKPDSLILQSGNLSLSQIIHSRQFWMVAAIVCCYAFAAFTVLIHIVLYAKGLKVSDADATNILTIIGGASLAGALITGSISDRIGYKSAYIICFIMMAAAFLWLVVGKQTWVLYPFAAIFGFAYGGERGVMPPLVAQLFGLGSLGTILGSVHFAATVGAALGPLLAGAIFDMTNSYQPAWVICTVLSVACVFMVLLLKAPLRKGQRKPSTLSELT